VPSNVRAALAIAVLSGFVLPEGVACGGRSGSHGDRSKPANAGGSAGSGAGGVLAAGGTTGAGGMRADAGAGTAGVAGAGAGGAAGRDSGSSPNDPPDFDFSRRHNLAVSYQIDTAHSGAQPDSRFVPPLVKRWSHTFGGKVSYPLIVDGRVFVTAKDERNTDTKLYALNAQTGTVLWQSERVGTGAFSTDVNPAYERGKVFVSSFDGDLIAFDAASGNVVWKIRLPDVYGFTTLPVAAGGAVFISGAANSRHPVFAIDGNTGKVLYDVASTVGRPLTLGGSLLYDGSGCSETFAFEARTGQQLWHFETGCFGGGSQPTVYHRGQIFVPDSARPIVVLDAATGDERRFRLSGFWAPACAGDNGFLVVGQELSAVDLRDARVLWKLALGSSSSFDSAPIVPPIVVNGFVYVVDRKGALSAVNAASGNLVWKDQMATDDRGWVDGGGGPTQAIGAGEERLMVPFQRSLHAYF